ncbi:hypothetical protein BU24DRAFT_405919 [Aaosphaeria arxii CBS 175.79]|uniref:Uncharacterized protein n=1 Tax=Aaosphaeria arxii CBS 175.79 TaxID=1450172 RepID=A0A6A5Y1V9_9PLEO|nr:uncharacterized protein BU24DRAFT_405919 [Aaosphaeria arxii CBS 175.79]KAF2019216.1 hypothetical protein BU24DRAFT_405919 [Aaosphaeria arxii CBS 175.79]
MAAGPEQASFFEKLNAEMKHAMKIWDIFAELVASYSVDSVKELGPDEAADFTMPQNEKGTEIKNLLATYLPPTSSEETPLWSIVRKRLIAPDFPIYAAVEIKQLKYGNIPTPIVPTTNLPNETSADFHRRGLMMTDMCSTAGYFLYDTVVELAKGVDPEITVLWIAVVPNPRAAWKAQRNAFAVLHELILFKCSNGEEFTLDLTAEQYGIPSSDRFMHWEDYRAQYVLDKAKYSGQERHQTAANGIYKTMKVHLKTVARSWLTKQREPGLERLVRHVLKQVVVEKKQDANTGAVAYDIEELIENTKERHQTAANGIYKTIKVHLETAARSWLTNQREPDLERLIRHVLK